MNHLLVKPESGDSTSLKDFYEKTLNFDRDFHKNLRIFRFWGMVLFPKIKSEFFVIKIRIFRRFLKPVNSLIQYIAVIVFRKG